MTEKYDKPCNVSGKSCNAPAGLSGKWGIYVCDYKNGAERGQGARLTCFSCGNAVCENCSDIYDYYHYGRKIICDDCAKEHELNKKSTIMINANSLMFIDKTGIM